MKILPHTTFPFPVHESWYANKSRIKRIFTRLTGYDIMFEESREDLMPVKNPKKDRNL